MTPNREKDEAVLRALKKEMFSTFRHNDLDGFLSIMSDNIVFMPPNMRTLYGKESIRQLVGPWFETLNMRHEVVKTEIEIGTDLACVMSDYKDSFWPKSGGEKTMMDNKGLYTFKRVNDETWVMTHCIWNRNTPVDQTPIIDA